MWRERGVKSLQARGQIREAAIRNRGSPFSSANIISSATPGTFSVSAVHLSTYCDHHVWALTRIAASPRASVSCLRVFWPPSPSFWSRRTPQMSIIRLYIFPTRSFAHRSDMTKVTGFQTRSRLQPCLPRIMGVNVGWQPCTIYRHTEYYSAESRQTPRFRDHCWLRPVMPVWHRARQPIRIAP